MCDFQARPGLNIPAGFLPVLSVSSRIAQRPSEVLMKSSKWLPIALLTLLAICIPLALSAADAHSSNSTNSSTQPLSLLHVRIVRLSFVQGQVAIRRPGESDWTAATVNTPIEEGFSLSTTATSFAEVEFENGSTARIGQGSQVDFTELALTPQGDKINKLALNKGYATFHFTPEHHDQYQVSALGVTLIPRGKVEFRTNFTGDSLRVEVFDGQVTAEHDGKSEEVSKNRVLTYDPNAVEAFNATSNIQKDAWDKWTQARDEQSVLATNEESASLNSPLFGWSDLDTYGDWSFFPGYGYGWAPYEPAGWSPYSAGAFGYYPGWGFTWISAEPWGWLPFHNGFWNYDASMGWFWMPGPLEAWSPALVNWYEGPGWVGWTPIGSGAASCAIAMPGCLTAVTPSTLESGTPLRPGSPVVIHPGGLNGINRISPPQLQNTVTGRAAASVASRVVIGGNAVPASESVMHAAPSSVVMGKEVAPDTFLSHHGFFSGPEAIHAQAGRTMGGTFPTVVDRHGVVSPDMSRRPEGPQSSAVARMPMVMAHGSAGASAASVGPRGGVNPTPANVGGGMSASERGGTSAAASAPAPAASAPAASSGSASSSSGAARSSSVSPGGGRR